jgi:dipeptidyl aminopeptidase/acylaminoacyl peptidase
VPENRLGMASENVAFETSDGLTLKGWYVPSRNGAAVIAFPGRKGPQPHTRMLARHGYGVLLFDRRGEGASDGDPNSYGWGGEKDIEAAVAYLRRRPDVNPERIGGIGLSVGGELMIQAAAATPALKAVVSDGAGYRSIRETEDMPRRTLLDRLVGLPGSAVMTAGVTVFSNHAPPADLKRYAARIAPRPLLLIADPDSGHTEELNAGFYGAAGEPKALWEIPGAGHVGGIRTHAAEYERRVVGFFDRALRTAS